MDEILMLLTSSSPTSMTSWYTHAHRRSTSDTSRPLQTNTGLRDPGRPRQLCFPSHRSHVTGIRDVRQGLIAAARPGSRPPGLPNAPDIPSVSEVPGDAELLPPIPTSCRSHTSTSAHPPRRPTYQGFAIHQLDTRNKTSLRGVQSQSFARHYACSSGGNRPHCPGDRRLDHGHRSSVATTD